MWMAWTNSNGEPMGDRFTTSVTIGGPLDEPLLREIIGEAVADGFSIDWEGTEKEDYILAKCIAKLRAGEKHLDFNDHEIPNDLLEAFTDFLKTKGVPWNATVDAKFEYDGEFRWWRPGMEADETSTADHDCTEAVATASTLKKWLSQGWSLEAVVKHMEDIPPNLPDIVWSNTPTPSEKGG